MGSRYSFGQKFAIIWGMIAGGFIAAALEPPTLITFKEEPQYCILAVPPFQLSPRPHLEVLRCLYGSTQNKCTVDPGRPGYIIAREDVGAPFRRD